MGRTIRKYVDRRAEGTFKIQITSMVDMFVILLVFLLKSYSTSPVDLTPSQNLTLPSSTSMKDPVDALKLVISKSGVFVEDKKVADLENGEISKTFLDGKDPMFIRTLYDELDKHAEKSKKIAKVNETVEFDGKAVVQADRDLSYSVLKKIMYTSMLAGYSDLKLAVVSNQ